MPRPCLICSDHRKLARAAELIAAGNSDQAVANVLNAMTPDMPAMSLMAVSRHRRSHILAPAKALAEAAGKGREVAEQRAQVLAAAEAGDPSAFVALAGIVADLRKVHERLEATADAAARDNQRVAVASLSAQQLRAAEVRAKIGGVGSYGAAKANGPGGATPFNVVINFAGGRKEQISMIPIAHGDVPDIGMAHGVQPLVGNVIDALPEPLGYESDLDDDA
jgi:hypothetical protein